MMPRSVYHGIGLGMSIVKETDRPDGAAVFLLKVNPGKRIDLHGGDSL